MGTVSLCTFGYLWPFSVHEWAINCHSVKMYHRFVLSPHLNCLVYEARESIKMTRWAQSLLLLKTGCKSRRLYCHFTHPNDTGHFNTQRTGEKKEILRIHFHGLARLEKQEATVFIRKNKTLMAFLIFGLPGAAYSGMHFPLDLPGPILYRRLLNAVGEATEKPFTNLVVVYMPIKSGLNSAYIDMTALCN